MIQVELDIEHISNLFSKVRELLKNSRVQSLKVETEYYLDIITKDINNYCREWEKVK